MNQGELIPHLFRTEFRKITAVLCKHFGPAHIEMAEDIAGETFLAALETWPFKGIPENPVAWLYTVAKNKARNVIHRQQIFRDKVVDNLHANAEIQSETEIDLSDRNITDSQLQMLFAICHPAISPEAQIALALRILCGFGIDEIANAFLTNKETINKRLFRAKEKLRQEAIEIALPPVQEIPTRLESVLTTLYLLFNEGYYSETNNAVLREDLCLEAMRLTFLLIENPETDEPQVNALLALMCFHASRFPARKNDHGEMILYDEQDVTLWDTALINKGVYYLHKSARGEELSRYHLEASIAFWHTQKEDSPEKWNAILQLYDQLLQHSYSPIAALNRTYAVSKVKGLMTAIREAEKLDLSDYHFYHLLLSQLYQDIDRNKCTDHLYRALELAKTEADKTFIQRKIDSVNQPA